MSEHIWKFGGWWGEGDEKFFIDGEKYPSTVGTGSEDYIGYAWAANPPFVTFDSALAAVSRTGRSSSCRKFSARSTHPPRYPW